MDEAVLPRSLYLRLRGEPHAAACTAVQPISTIICDETEPIRGACSMVISRLYSSILPLGSRILRLCLGKR